MSRLQPISAHIHFPFGENDFAFIPTGDVHAFHMGPIQVNQFQGDARFGSTNNLYLRVHGPEGIRHAPLLGACAKSRLSHGPRGLCYEGTFEAVRYRVTFLPARADLWFWHVALEGDGQTVDVVYGQDLGMAETGAVLTNELYAAQYLGHTVFQTETGYVVRSRQNQPQSGAFPAIQQGMALGRAVAYSTDAMQFYAADFRHTRVPAALSGDLPSRNLQFELPYIALQSQRIEHLDRQEFAFYGLFTPDHPNKIESAVPLCEILPALHAARAAADSIDFMPVDAPRVRAEFGPPLSCAGLNAAALDGLYPERRFEERNDTGTLLSFFLPNGDHVVMPEKERIVWRPHRHILLAGLRRDRVNADIMASSNAMYGMFHGQTVVGNTSFHKFLSVHRGLLDRIPNGGLRMYVRVDGAYRMLGIPAAYEMSPCSTRWIYTIPGDRLEVRVQAALDRMEMNLTVQSASGKTHDLLLACQVVMGENERENPFEMTEIPGGMRFSRSPGTALDDPHPDWHVDARVSDPDATWSDDRVFFEEGRPQDPTLITIQSRSAAFTLQLTGSLCADKPDATAAPIDPDAERAAFEAFYDDMTGAFRLDAPGEMAASAEKLTLISRWFAHDAMVHFASPHGLEQTGGAAWGTRDVCQGPFEWFLATDNRELARDTLLRVFSHQSFGSGEWPQWFMFDGFPQHADECHGDVVFWPLNCVAAYLRQTGDASILDVAVPYADGAADAALRDHLVRAVDVVAQTRVIGEGILTYAGGDWDDTLQPADPSLRERLSSAWTQALAHQALRDLADALPQRDGELKAKLSALADALHAAFHRVFIRDGVIAGFMMRDADGALRPLLHPSDAQTGIHYRLLPMTRSIIANMVDMEQARQNMRLIDEHLSFPDGVRLMDRPARYDGGVSLLFRRAEQAANVGREISLQYVHAHIRYIEALAALGDGERAWSALQPVNPIGLKDAVPNAAPRQSNHYFSSSDGAFYDRYEYARDFERLRSGDIAVQGGWRLYSSGPGIYLHQVISNVLGVRFEGDRLILDPVLPVAMDGARLRFRCFGRDIDFRFRIVQGAERRVYARCADREWHMEAPGNRYRRGGVGIPREELPENGAVVEVCIVNGA